MRAQERIRVALARGAVQGYDVFYGRDASAGLQRLFGWAEYRESVCQLEARSELDDPHEAQVEGGSGKPHRCVVSGVLSQLRDVVSQ